MKIERISFRNFRRFTDFSLSFHEQLTVLVAQNGSGKTSILDGLAICLGSFLTHLPGITGINFKTTDFQQSSHSTKAPYMRLECYLKGGISWDRTEKRDKSSKTSKDIPQALGLRKLKEYADTFIDALNEGKDIELPLIAYYGTGRAVFEMTQRKRNFKKTFTRIDGLRGCLESRANFKRFVEYFYALEEKELRKQRDEKNYDLQIPELKAIRQAVKEILPKFSNPTSVEPAGIEMTWQHAGQVKKLRMEQLSDGYRTTLAMVMDIASRMAELNPSKKNPLLTQGIVMIDEIDLHLHPSWQQTILLDLMRTFPNVQFIVSTHSPQVLSSVKPQSLCVLDWDEDTPTVRPIFFSEGAEAQHMLLDVLGVSHARVTHLEIVQSLIEYQKLVEQDMWDSPRALELERELKKWGGEFEPELIRLKTDIQMKEWERQQG